jgi:hypothetical protein
MTNPNESDRPGIGRTTADQDDRMPKRGEPAEQAAPEPDATRGSDRGGSGGWGSEGSGGSVIDKRSPKKTDR